MTDKSSGTASAEIYNPETHSWMQIPDMNAVRFFHMATLLANGKVLVVGGERTGYQVTGAELYDPVTNTWAPTGRMNVERSRHVATLQLDGTVLVTGGFTNDGTQGYDLDVSEIYDPVTNSWSVTHCLNDARNLHSAMLLNDGNVLAVGGYGTLGALTSAELYTPDNPVPTLVISDVQATNVGDTDATITWLTNYQGDAQVEYGTDVVYGSINTLHPALVLSHSIELTNLTPDTTYHFRVLSHDAGGNLVTSGDFSFTTPVPVCLLWDIAPSLSTTRYGQAQIQLRNGDVLVAGGRIPANDLASAEVYDPTSDVWLPVLDMGTARNRPAATLLSDGRVLVVGGSGYYSSLNYVGSGTPLASAEIYDPVANNWSPAADMSIGRGGHTATLLNNGKVLVIGGVTDQGDVAQASAEIYDPVTNIWSPAASMNVPRLWHTATLLADGRVLVAGGSAHSDVEASGYSSAEIYDPVANTLVPGA